MRRSIPNLISASRLVLAFPLGLMLWLSGAGPAWRWAVIALFVGIAVGDALDGYLARRFSAQTALGRVLDPAADKVLALVCFVVLVLISRRGEYFPIPLWLVAVVVGKDLWTVAGYATLRMMGIDIAVRPSIWGKTSTFFQLVLIASILVTPELKHWLYLDWCQPLLVWLTAIITIVAAVNYTGTAIHRLTTVQLVELPERGKE